VNAHGEPDSESYLIKHRLVPDSLSSVPYIGIGPLADSNSLHFLRSLVTT